MNARRLIDLSEDRVQDIVATITDEVKSGSSAHWDLPFDEYVSERIGDLDIDADSEQDFKSKERQIRAAVYHLAARHERNRRS